MEFQLSFQTLEKLFKHFNLGALADFDNMSNEQRDAFIRDVKINNILRDG